MVQLILKIVMLQTAKKNLFLCEMDYTHPVLPINIYVTFSISYNYLLHFISTVCVAFYMQYAGFEAAQEWVWIQVKVRRFLENQNRLSWTFQVQPSFYSKSAELFEINGFGSTKVIGLERFTGSGFRHLYFSKSYNFDF